MSAAKGTGIHRRRRRRAGSVLFLVVVAMAVAMVLGLTFMHAAATTTGVARAVDDHAQARRIAESGVALAIGYVERTPEWRSDRASGTWIDQLELLDGTVTVAGTFTESSDPESIAIDDSSFELEIGELDTPALAPPMSGTVGGWDVQRQATLETGPTVPRIGTIASADATDGANVAFIAFDPLTVGSATFGQTLAATLEPSRRYELAVDIQLENVLTLDGSYGFRLMAGTTLVATTDESLSTTEGLTSEEITAQATALLDEATNPSTLEVSPLAGPFDRYRMSFHTLSDPPAGPIRIELFAESTVGVSQVMFDNVRLEAWHNDPLVLTATARFASASHAASATVVLALDGSGRIIEWSEP